MAWRSSGKCNKTLAENLWINGMITTEAVKKAFLAVDRAHYAPSRPYDDTPQSIGYSATISAPHMHANAAESLLPYLLPSSSSSTRRPRRVLDIGSGSGYLTHIFAELAGADAVVVGVEHIGALRDLGEVNMRKSPEGRALLASGRVRFRVGDGRKGWVEPEVLNTAAASPSDAEAIEAGRALGEKDEHGKNVGGAADESDAQGWDAIHVGAAAAELHEELVRQLRRPGRMFIPVEDEGGLQYIWTVDKDEDGKIEKKKLFGVRYVPLTDAPGTN
ncbi:protein-L-isoaspartate O-methyltransferase-domain-containing protein [Xylaria sp. FL1042]|nr:protein-L-isoaspartate O-methyltransferase-domain-containing protein [Xylaria sp. FL1042]